MPDLTPNFGFEKGRPLEKFNRAQVNRNWDKVDTQLQKAIQPTSTYYGTLGTFLSVNGGNAKEVSGNFRILSNGMGFFYVQWKFPWDVAVSSTGDIGNLNIGSLKSGFVPIFDSPLTSMALGRGLWGAAYANNDVNVTACSGTSNISKNATNQLSGMLILK